MRRAITLAERLRTMSRQELSWRARTQLRARAQEVVFRVRPQEWRREDIRQALAIETLPADLQEAADRGDWRAVHDSLRAHLRRRPSRFVLNPRRMNDVRREVRNRWPEAEADAIDRARSIVDGRFDLLGFRSLSFSSGEAAGVDWHFDPVHRRRMPMAFWSRVPFLDPACGDHKVIWELNRQQHWLALSRALWLTGDRAYADAMVRDLAGWIAANPPLVGANWASMLELAFRSLSWLWGLHAIQAVDEGDRRPSNRTEEPWLVDLFVALDRQLRHVEQNLSVYFSPNTHLTGEALALYVCGAALPELAASPQWIDTGRRVLLEEADRQIEPDGGHVERSTHYHRYTLDFYLLALLTARRIGDVDAEERFSEALRRLAPFARAMADGRGRLPRIGDDDAGKLWPIAGRDSADVRDSLALAATVLDRRDLAPWGATEEVFWLTSNDSSAFERALSLGADDRRVRERRTLPFRPAVRPDAQPERSSVLVFPHAERRRQATERRGQRPDRRSAHRDATGRRVDRRVTNVFSTTGFVTSTTDSGDHLVLDAGPHGYLNGGHAHADALSVVLTLRHKPLLVDPGTPTYTMDPALRDQSRSSISHNTLTIDNRSSAIPLGPFHWQTRADARLELVRHNSRFSLIEATHDGYPNVSHRRVLLATDRGYLFIDQITGEGEHEAAQHWHFDPRWRVACESGHSLRLLHESGDAAWLAIGRGTLSLVTADESSPLGWVSPAYGVRVPAWTARVTERASVPFAMVSWCADALHAEAPSLECVACDADAGAAAIAVCIRTAEDECLSILRPGDSVARSGRLASVGTLRTDARAVQCAWSGGVLSSVCLADGSYVHVDGQLNIDADEVLSDLHLTVDGGRLDLFAGGPPGGLRVTGPMLHAINHVTGNGHTLRRPDAPPSAVVLTAPDWAEPVSGVQFQDRDDVRYRRVR